MGAHVVTLRHDEHDGTMNTMTGELNFIVLFVGIALIVLKPWNRVSGNCQRAAKC